MKKIMRKLDKLMKVAVVLLLVLVQFVFVPAPAARAATAPGLGAAGSFSVLGATSVTSATPSTVSGDLGVSPGTSITGTITVGGATHNNDATAAQAQTDVGTAHANIMAQGATGSIGPALDGLSLVPGVYDIGAGRLNGGVLTLNGAGVYIFRASSDFTSSGSISLINGATACNVFWDVTTLATINGNSFVGTIIAGTGVHFGNGVTLDGRALARGGDVTMIGDTISGPGCSTSATTTDTGTVSVFCPEIGAQVVAPVILESRRVSPTSIFIRWGPYSGINEFNVQYGTTPTSWEYGTGVTGFSTTINALPANTNIWVRVAPRSSCTIGLYGPAALVGGSKLIIIPLSGPRLPNTGFGPRESVFSYLTHSFSVFSSFFQRYIGN